MRRRKILKTVGGIAIGSTALVGSGSADQGNHTEEIQERTKLEDKEGYQEDREIPVVGGEAPESVKEKAREKKATTIGTNAASSTKTDSDSEILDDNLPCGQIYTETELNGTWLSFLDHGGMEAKYQANGGSSWSAFGCGTWDSERPDELNVSTELSVNGINITITVGSFGVQQPTSGDTVSYSNTFQNEVTATHEYSGFEAESTQGLYDATQSASLTAVFDTDARSVYAQVTHDGNDYYS